MNRLFARAATLVLALPLAVGAVAGTAQAQTHTVKVPGCYGAGFDWAIVCNLTLTTTTPEPVFSVVYAKVCVGDCYNVPVTWVETTNNADVCYSYTDGAGRPVGACSSQVLAVLDPSLTDMKPLHEWFACSNSQTTACTYQ